MRALVTGGAGFIGSNLVDELLRAGHQVAVVDNLSTGRASNLTEALQRGAVLHEVDVTDAAGLDEMLQRERPDAVFHLAAQIDVRKSVRDPAFDARVNVEGTANLLEAARRADVGRLVFSSTGGAIYGETDVLPTPEDVPPRPKAPYGLSKFCGEAYCGAYARWHGLSTVSLRYGNVYGPRQDPLGEAGVVAILCGKLLAGEPLTVNGDGRQTRDYVFVGDVVAANIAAIEHPAAAGAFNIGTGVESSVLDLVEALRGLAGPEGVEVRHLPLPAGEVARSCLDVRLARNELGWQPRISLADGLAPTLAATRGESTTAGA
jgi:UDP-glucose 4-epimerase